MNTFTQTVVALVRVALATVFFVSLFATPAYMPLLVVSFIGWLICIYLLEDGNSQDL